MELIGKPFNECRIAYVPTAGNPITGDKSYIKMNMDSIRRLKPQTFELIDISKIPKSVWFSSFQKSDVLAFGGGSAEYLLNSLEKSGVKDAFSDLLKTRVYFGSSEGGMVMAKTVSLSKIGLLYWEKTGKFKDREGLGFVDFEIRPHYNRSNFPEVRDENLEKIAKENPAPLYAIDDATAVKVVDGKVTVISEGKWKKFN